MLIDISLLLSNVVNEVKIDNDITFSQDDIKNSGMLSLENVHITGLITKDSSNNLTMDINITGDMYLACAITLKPVKYPFNIEIVDEKIEKNENILRKDENTLELKPFLWENIVVEIPLRVVSDDAYENELKGSGWQLISDEDYVKTNKALSGLSKLLESKEEK